MISNHPRYFSYRLLIIPGILLLLLACGSIAFAHPAASRSSASLQFSIQERIGFPSGDDWEPSITADRYGHIYALYKHYDVSGGQTCNGCDLHLLFQRSSDGGRTWTAPRPIAPVAVKGGQYDPQIAVDPVDGRTVWASFLQNANSLIAVVKSTDFGQTWSAPRIVTNLPPGLDKVSLQSEAIQVSLPTMTITTPGHQSLWMVDCIGERARCFGPARNSVCPFPRTPPLTRMAISSLAGIVSTSSTGSLAMGP